MEDTYKAIGETNVAEDPFSMALFELAKEQGYTDFIFTAFNATEGKKTGASVVNCKDATMMVVLLYALFKQYPMIFKLFFNTLLEIAGSADGQLTAALGKDKAASTEEEGDININDFIAREK